MSCFGDDADPRFRNILLAKNRDIEPCRYGDRRGNTLEMFPSGKGMPTICDKDFPICAISHVMVCLNDCRM